MSSGYVERSVEQGGGFSCDTCGKTFAHRGMMRRHVNKHLAVNAVTYKCGKCDQTFRYKSTLVRHEKRAHTDDLPWQCTVDGCNRRFRYETALEHHRLIHEDRRDHACEICGKCFRTKQKLHEHLSTHASNTNGRIRCTRGCGQEFNGVTSWLKHQVDHPHCGNGIIPTDTPTTIPRDLLETSTHKRARTLGPNLITFHSL